MKKRNFTFMPDGDTSIEKIFTIFRHHCGIIAKRQREMPRCHRCFTHGWIGGEWKVNHGCDGCSEMHDFIAAAREAFTREADGREVTKG